ncbi:hypothetical protein JW707_03755 [Candidatus Woesearchaeota archaeon]|nr:hypothetical protein [Candidatus Woesearchaeota archaeon]
MAKTKHLFLTTVFLLVIIFILGIMIGRHFSSSRVDEITNFIQDNELNTESYLIEQELIENFEQGNCELANARISDLGADLWQLGKSLSPDDAEQRLGAKNYYFMKRKYHLMQIRTYILLYKLKQHCNNTDSVILFYFSRDDAQSEEQGKILDDLVKEYKLHIFAVEYNYSKEISFLEEYYNINETPSIIVDYDSQMQGLVSYEDIKKTINK